MSRLGRKKPNFLIYREIYRKFKIVYCKIKLATYRKKHLKEVKYSQTKN